MRSTKLALLGLLASLAIAGINPVPVSAAPLAAFTHAGAKAEAPVPGLAITPVAARRCPPFCAPYTEQHKRFHKRYHPRQPNFNVAHDRFHKVHRRPHKHPRVRIGIYGGFYDPFFYRPYDFDPYYVHPYYVTRISCERARRLLRQHGYRNLRAYDCQGRTYGFYATKSGKRYKIKVSARDGHIISRSRY